MVLTAFADAVVLAAVKLQCFDKTRAFYQLFYLFLKHIYIISQLLSEKKACLSTYELLLFCACL